MSRASSFLWMSSRARADMLVSRRYYRRRTGPLVYGIAYCPASFSPSLKSVGFADSKALIPERRDALLAALINNPDNLGWATQSMSPQDISAGMLRRRPHNLNAQSTEATVLLISGVLESGVDVAEVSQR